MTFHVDSEVGQLQQVIVHRPGLELTRLTPENVEDLLFDDVMWAERAREEHDAFVAQLRARGVTVHHFAKLLTEALDEPGRPRRSSRSGSPRRPGSGRRWTSRWTSWSSRRRRPTLAELLIGGVLKHDLASLLDTPSLLMKYLADDDFLLRPLPNHLFQRDNSAWVYDGLSINPMAKPARKRETFNSRVVYNFHPMFRDAGLTSTTATTRSRTSRRPSRAATSWSSATAP